jgi:hypothetical protein
MKNIIISALIIAFATTSCQNKVKEEESKSTQTTETTSQLYSCPMHPEVQGKKGESCSKCGMELTEPVTTSDNKINEKSSQDSIE